jgi:hypothetical protein
MKRGFLGRRGQVSQAGGAQGTDKRREHKIAQRAASGVGVADDGEGRA